MSRSTGAPRARGTRRWNGGRGRRGRRGIAAVVAVVLLLIANLVVIGAVLGGSRDHDLTIRRIETVQAFYAAEGGMNMAIRELMQGSDEDGDGTVGSISDDGNDANDPALGQARVVVTKTVNADDSTLESAGRAGAARRSVEALVEE